jgi:Ca2+-binding EF-hand superfamily protein
MPNKISMAIRRGESFHGNSKAASEAHSYLRRKLCGFHLEDERRQHTEESTNIVKKGHSHQEMGIADAKKLVAGQAITFQWRTRPRWPMFMLYTKGIDRIRDTMLTYFLDENKVQKQVALRVRKEEAETSATKMMEEPDDSSGSEGSESDTSLSQSESTRTLSKQREDDDTDSALEMGDLREVFNLVDSDGGGTIDAGELGQLLHLLGMPKDEVEIKQLISTITDSPSGEFSFREFAQSLKSRQAPQISYEKNRILEAFTTFSKQPGDGCTIFREDLIGALTSFDGKWENSEAVEMLRDAGLAMFEVDYNAYTDAMFDMYSTDREQKKP